MEKKSSKKLKKPSNKQNNSKLYGPILWIEFTCLKAVELQRGGSLFLTIKSPHIPGAHLVPPIEMNKE